MPSLRPTFLNVLGAATASLILLGVWAGELDEQLIKALGAALAAVAVATGVWAFWTKNAARPVDSSGERARGRLGPVVEDVSSFAASAQLPQGHDQGDNSSSSDDEQPDRSGTLQVTGARDDPVEQMNEGRYEDEEDSEDEGRSSGNSGNPTLTSQADSTTADDGDSERSSQPRAEVNQDDSHNESCDNGHTSEAQEHSESSGPKQEFVLLLLGKTGNGKSATGNSILMCQSFETSMDASSGTFDVREEWAEVDNYMVKVVDGPGIEDAGLNHEEATKKACSDMAQAMACCLRGFHALLLVLKFGNKFTKEEDTINLLKMMFGENIIRDYCVIVVTNGDSFDLNADQIGITFSDWLSRQEGSLKKILAECKYRCVLFRNLTKDRKRKKQQVLDLLEVVRSLKHRDVRYTYEHFESMSKQRNRLIVEATAPHLREELKKEISLVISDLVKLRDMERDTEAANATLIKLEQKVSHLLQEIDTQDQGTGVFDNIKGEVNTVKEIIKLERCANEQRKEEKTRQEQMRKQHEDQMAEMKRQHLSDQQLLQSQLTAAKEQGKAPLLQKMEALEVKAAEQESKMLKNFEVQQEAAKHQAEQKWETMMNYVQFKHRSILVALKEQYQQMNAQTVRMLRAEIQELKDRLVEV